MIEIMIREAHLSPECRARAASSWELQALCRFAVPKSRVDRRRVWPGIFQRDWRDFSPSLSIIFSPFSSHTPALLHYSSATSWCCYCTSSKKENKIKKSSIEKFKLRPHTEYHYKVWPKIKNNKEIILILLKKIK